MADFLAGQPPDDESEEKPSRWANLPGLVILVGLVVGTVWLAVAMLPGHVAPEQNPSSLNLVVANRWVIWLARLCGLALLVIFVVFAVYVVRSISHRMSKGHWLKIGGPFEAEIVEAGNALEDVEELFLDSLGAANHRIAELEEQLGESNALVAHLAKILEHASGPDPEGPLET